MEDLQLQGVASTNDDAQISKLSCVKLGYFKDPLVSLFVRRPSKRPPLINRGYYARCTAIKTLISDFLQLTLDGDRQIISLGAGYDTNFFILKAENSTVRLRYVEVDLPTVVKKKSQVIQEHEQLRSAINGTAQWREESGEVTSTSYSLVSADLRDLAQVQAALGRAGVDPRLPTLVLAECVLVYMEGKYSQQLVTWLGSYFHQAAFVVYEQVNPDDPFGRQMLSNLELRGCPLKGCLRSLEDHEIRFTENGWDHAEAVDMDKVYRCYLDKEDLRRVERLEIFDEFEEWKLIQQHYALTVAVNRREGLLERFGLQIHSTHPPPPLFIRGE